MAEKANEKAGGGRRTGCIGLLVWILLILAAITAIAAVVFLHTEDGRKAIEERAEKWFGMDLTVQEVTLGWPPCLVLRGVEADPPTPGSQPLFRAREVRIGVGHGRRWRMELYRPNLALVRNAEGGWGPGCFGRIGELPNMKLEDLGPLTEDLRGRVDLNVAEGTVRWLGSDGGETVSAAGVNFRITPVDIPDRCMYQYVLTAQTVLHRDGTRAYDVQREWLSSEELEYVELHNSEGKK